MRNATIEANITIAADCLPMISELISRLGGALRLSPKQKSVKPYRNELKTLRERAKLTQEALAAAIGVPQSHISDYERSRRAVPYKYAQKLARALKASPSDFMIPNDETIKAINELEQGESERASSLEEAYKKLGL
ncbi:MAG: helix-turn-helix transcriptional regulator [Helicobacteraceae bacterium]|jgi:transcriptional regulator with XRE-family HTH domain|nr:helix-turn-helix transcriptional regulator [Helicobacteraceae bacterium]